MFALLTILLMAPPPGSGSSGGGLLGTLLPIILIFVVFYFFLIRPQQKKQKERDKMLESLGKGDKVVTVGGAHGVVESLEDGNTVIVRLVPSNIAIKFDKSSISSITRPVEKSEK